MSLTDGEYISEAAARRLLNPGDDRRMREAALVFGLAVSQIETRKPLSPADQHQESFNLAGRCFYLFNSEWLNEIGALDRLYCCAFHEEARAGQIPDSHLDFFASECYRVLEKFHLPNLDVLWTLYGQFCIDQVDRRDQEWSPIWPPVAREVTIPYGKFTATIRLDPTLQSKRQRFKLVPVAATLFTHYLSRSGGGTLSYDRAIDHFEFLFCPFHYGGDDPDFPFDLLTYHLDRDQFFRNLRRFSCLFAAPFWQFPAPQLLPPPGTTAPSLS